MPPATTRRRCVINQLQRFINQILQKSPLLEDRTIHLSLSVAHDPYDNPNRDNPGQLKIDFLAPHRLPPVHRWQVYCHSILLGRTVLMYTCSRKKFTTLTCYNSDTHGQILIIFGRSVTEKDCDVSSYWLLDVA